MLDALIEEIRDLDTQIGELVGKRDRLENKALILLMNEGLTEHIHRSGKWKIKQGKPRVTPILKG